MRQELALGHPRLNPDLLISAAIVHDVGKTREFTYVSDAVEGTIKAAAADVVGMVFNLGGGSRVTVNKELATLEKVPQTLRNVRVTRRVAIEDMPAVREALARAEDTLRARGRVFLRYSGTEPLLRILVEGLAVQLQGGACHSGLRFD